MAAMYCSQPPSNPPPNFRLVSIPAIHSHLSEVRSAAPETESGYGRSVLVPAGRAIRKRPLSQFAWAMTGDQPIAVVARPDRH